MKTQKEDWAKEHPDQVKGVILCIIILDVHQFIGHCLFLLDTWVIQQNGLEMILPPGILRIRVRQLKINWCTFPMGIIKITSSVYLN